MDLSIFRAGGRVNASLVPVVLGVFLCVAFLGYVVARVSVVFWGQYRETFTEQARFNLSDMFMDTRKLFYANAAALFVIPVLIWLLSDNIVVAAITVAVLIFLPRKIYTLMRQRRIDRIQQ